MTRMISIHHSFEASLRAIQAHDETLSKGINEVARM